MAGTNYMMSAEEVKTIAIARRNFDKFLIKDSIIEAAEKEYIKPLVGEKFYEELLSQYKAGNLSSDNQKLVNEYLKKALAYYIVYLCLPTMHMDVSSAGIMVNNTEFSQPVSSAQRSELAENIRSIAQTFADEAISFIEKEKKENNKYPLYVSGPENEINLAAGIILDEE